MAGPVCPCKECYSEWAEEEIGRLQAQVKGKDEMIATVWEVSRTFYERLKEADKQRLIAEGKLEQFRLCFDQLSTNVGKFW